ncbi:exocyst complex component EXO70B1-like [Cucurbita moschata]|uniref:Exocyst subunit Exo70 family protein n=1 Tax=Cucurbita moschata TaxID=3662 RepID=A0A6J1E7L3_CUCMO|nr:exocyst complex component EXO70B1-like [Cucurbita moschata]XP_022923977.1 exocyst complex component EXO70B1-like [Cucurbita moschata]XP_022923978.1 exocyst complex component EXO70B1-like [Cucurbita moschata]XP_022923979.1 exocyst complex component EXO70B1-like [Cucurbita moschata]
MATTTTSIGGGGGGGGGGEDRVMATAQQIVKSLNTPKEVQEDMLLIFSSFDNRLSNISSLVNSGDSKREGDRYEASEKLILRWDSGPGASRNSLNWEDSPEEAVEYLSAVDDIIQWIDELSIRSDSAEIVDRAENAIQIAMSRLEDEFRHMLIRNTVPLDAEHLYGSIRKVSLSFASHDSENSDEFESFADVDRGSGIFHERGVSLGDDLRVDLINPDAVVDLKEIADRMIRSGYEKECLNVYTGVRRDALDECLVVLGVEKLSIEDVQKIDWKILDEKMKKWIQAVKVSVRVLLTGEKRLCDYIFSGSDDSEEVCFNETAKGCIRQLLNFAEAIAIGERSVEKLFRILDMYEALEYVLPDLQAMITDEFVIEEAQGVLSRLGEAAKGTFVEFENAVRNETSKKTMLNAEIHPLTRYVMNYLTLVVVYSKTLDALLEGDDEDLHHLGGDGAENLELETMSPLPHRLFSLLSSLETNLERKSKLYGDDSIQYIFLMNNIQYIVQKAKDSELGKLLGDRWVRKRRGQVRIYATNYLRASWGKLLTFLKEEGTGGSSNSALKLATLKEKFKNFNAGFEEIYRIQTGWKVADAQLREELRISVSAKALPAYRAFLGRHGSQLENTRHAGRYIKYTSDDLENYLLDLFEGSPQVIHNLRRKSSS